jgi:hypothetical protein
MENTEKGFSLVGWLGGCGQPTGDGVGDVLAGYASVGLYPSEYGYRLYHPAYGYVTRQCNTISWNSFTLISEEGQEIPLETPAVDFLLIPQREREEAVYVLHTEKNRIVFVGSREECHKVLARRGEVTYSRHMTNLRVGTRFAYVKTNVGIGLPDLHSGEWRERFLLTPAPLGVILDPRDRFLPAYTAFVREYAEEAIKESTRLSWGGGYAVVELFDDGTYRCMPTDTVGNKYESPGVIIPIPILTEEEWEEGEDGEEPFFEKAMEELSENFEQKFLES